MTVICFRAKLTEGDTYGNNRGNVEFLVPRFAPREILNTEGLRVRWSA